MLQKCTNDTLHQHSSVTTARICDVIAIQHGHVATSSAWDVAAMLHFKGEAIKFHIKKINLLTRHRTAF